jgi:hypothetical protein
MINQNLLLTGDDGYNLTNSLRFRASANAYLSRTGSTATDAKKATYSFWFKRGALTTGQWLFTGGAGGAVTLIGFNGSSDAFSVLLTDVSGEGNITTAVFRDPSAWYHFVIAIDTTQATTADRAKIYVNGVLQTVTLANGGIGINSNWGFNTANTLNIGRYTGGSSYTDGYMTEINFIDGQALTPSSFGETSTSTGVWIPKKFVGTYGTNGFYLPFTDNSALTTSSNVGLGKDFSGNSNYFATNNISITAGSTYDSMTDVPTLTSATAANYATFNPLNSANNGTLGGGNLNIDSNSGSASAQTTAGTMSMKSGKYYFEYTRVQSSNDTRFGIIRDDKFISGSNVGLSASEYGYYVISSGTLSVDGTTTSSWITAFSQGDVGMIAYDADTGKVWFGRNGTWGGSGDPAAGTNPAATVNSFATYGYTAWVRVIGGGSPAIEQGAINFGQRPFAYTPPTGFVRLNTFNLTTPTIGATAATTANKYFDVLTWTGNGASSRAITGLNFQPDWVWDKMRSDAYQHAIVDSVRGGNQVLHSNSTSAEDTNWQYGYVSSFDSNGFTIQAGSTSSENWNLNAATFVAWNWNAGGSTVTNTTGSISSQVRASTTAGFSIVTYTGNGTGGATVGHGLGVAPSMIIIKVRNATARWVFYQKDVTTANNQFLELNSTTGVDTSGTNFWTISSINSTTFGLGTNADTNGSTLTFVAYCFTPIAGYSAFGSYTGNGSSDGTFVFTGFRPRWLMIKRTDATQNWAIVDTSRDTFNVSNKRLFANLSDAEDTGISNFVDLLSNGFKFRDSNVSCNASGGTYIYMAFAENPFKYANAR